MSLLRLQVDEISNKGARGMKNLDGWIGEELKKAQSRCDELPEWYKKQVAYQQNFDDSQNRLPNNEHPKRPEKNRA